MRSTQAVRAVVSPIRQQRDLRVRQYFNLSYDATPATMLAFTSTGGPERGLPQPRWVGVLQCLRWRIQGIRHVSVHAGATVFRRASAHAACDSLVVSERFVRSGIDSAD